MTDGEESMFARIDERVKSLMETTAKFEARMDAAAEKLEAKLEEYTLLTRFLVTERLVFGVVGIIVVSVITTMVTLVLKR